jgi:hypothetical protein
MNTSQIERLLEKYYEGKTNLQEEQLLRDYFHAPDIPEHLREHASLFRYFSGAKTETIGPVMETRLTEAIGNEVSPAPRFRIRKLYTVLSVAASIILLVAIGITLRFEIRKEAPGTSQIGTITDPELAYLETRKALLKVSQNLNVGIGQMSKLQSFQSGIEKAQSLYQFDKYQPVIIHPDEHK